jgi:plasmid stabilization system protein ParE
MVKAIQVIWPQKARKQLREAYEYIKLDSVKNAEKVRKEILASTRQLGIAPKVYRPDKYKTDNDGSYRAFELHRYRISYHIAKDEVTIVRVRHTSMDPLEY